MENVKQKIIEMFEANGFNYPAKFFEIYDVVPWEDMPACDLYFDLLDDGCFPDVEAVVDHFLLNDGEDALLLVNSVDGQWPGVEHYRESWEEDIDVIEVDPRDLVSEEINRAWDALEALVKKPTKRFYTRGKKVCLVTRETFTEQLTEETEND